MIGLRASAARRIALISFCAYAVAMLLVAGAVYLATHAAFSRQINLSVEHASAALMAEYRDDGLAGLSRAVAMQHSPGPISLGTAVFAADGRHLAGNLATAAPAPGWHRITFLDPLEGPDTARAKVTLLPGGERLVVAADLEDLQAIDRAILGIFAGAMLVLLGIGVGGALVLARYLRTKLAVIEDTASAIVAGDFARRAPVGHNGDEFDRVAASLNAMLDQITSLIANLRQVSADLAHDLRTPLTGLRNHLERMAAHGASRSPWRWPARMRCWSCSRRSCAFPRSRRAACAAPSPGSIWRPCWANCPKRLTCWPRMRAKGWRRAGSPA